MQLVFICSVSISKYPYHNFLLFSVTIHQTDHPPGKYKAAHEPPQPVVPRLRATWGGESGAGRREGEARGRRAECMCTGRQAEAPPPDLETEPSGRHGSKQSERGDSRSQGRGEGRERERRELGQTRRKREEGEWK